MNSALRNAIVNDIEIHKAAKSTAVENKRRRHVRSMSSSSSSSTFDPDIIILVTWKNVRNTEQDAVCT
jgi:hypothetical protein